MADIVTDEELDNYDNLSPEEQADIRRRLELASQPSSPATEGGQFDVDRAVALAEQEDAQFANNSQVGEFGTMDYAMGAGSGIYLGLKDIVTAPYELAKLASSAPTLIEEANKYVEDEGILKGIGNTARGAVTLLPFGSYLLRKGEEREELTKAQEQKYKEEFLQKGMSPSMALAIANLKATGESYSSLGDVYPPSSPGDVEELAREITGIFGPSVITKTAGKLSSLGKKAGKWAGKAVPQTVKDVGRKADIEATQIAQGRLIATPARTEAARSLEDIANSTSERFKTLIPEVFRDVPTSRQDAALVEKRVLGYMDENLQRVPGTFEIAKTKRLNAKNEIIADVDRALPQQDGVLRYDIDVNNIEKQLEVLDKNPLKEIEAGELRDQQKMLLQTYGTTGIKSMSFQNMMQHVRDIDDELSKLAFYDEKSFRNYAFNPSTGDRIIARSKALKSIRDSLTTSQKKIISKTLGQKRAEEWDNLNKDLVTLIDHENYTKRLFSDLSSSAAEVPSSSILSTTRSGKRYLAEKIAPDVFGRGTGPAVEDIGNYVERMKLVGDIYSGAKPQAFPNQSIFDQPIFKRLGLSEKPTTPAERAMRRRLELGYGYGASQLQAGTEDYGFTPEAQAAELPSSLIDLLSQPQQPPMTPEPPAPMAGGEQITSLLNSLATTGEEEEMKLPGTETMDQMNQLQGLDFINQMSGQPAAPMVAPEQEGMAPAMPGAPEAPPASVGGMLGQLPEMAGGAMPTEGASLMAQRQAFKPVKPTMDNVINNAGQIAQQITSLLGPQEANNVLQQLQDAIQSKNDAAVGKVVTAFTKTYPEAAQIFEDEFPDMPIFTFGGKIYQADDRAAYEKWIGDSKASSIEKAKSLSALNTDGTVRLPKGR